MLRTLRLTLCVLALSAFEVGSCSAATLSHLIVPQNNRFKDVFDVTTPVAGPTFSAFTGGDGGVISAVYAGKVGTGLGVGINNTGIFAYLYQVVVPLNGGASPGLSRFELPFFGSPSTTMTTAKFRVTGGATAAIQTASAITVSVSPTIAPTLFDPLINSIEIPVPTGSATTSTVILNGFSIETLVPISSATVNGQGGANVATRIFGFFSTIGPRTIGVTAYDASNNALRGASAYTPGVIPEPSSILLLGIGGAGLAFLRRKKKITVLA